MRFYLDGTLYDNPNGWQNIQSKIELNEDLQLLTVVDDVDLDFSGAAYAYLRSKLDSGFCNVIEVRVQQDCGNNQWRDVIKGRIFVSDIIFNERTCLAKCKIEDNSYFATINNNANIRTVPDAGLAKMGTAITPAEVYAVDVQSIANPPVVIRTVDCCRVFEAFRTLVAFMSDGTVGFASNLFDIGGRWEGLCITTGERLATGSATLWTSFSFEELFSEIRAKIPIRMIIENPFTNPVLRVEDEDYFTISGNVMDLDNIYEIVTRCDINKLFGKVRVGNRSIDDTVTLSFPEDINYFGFKTEEMYIKTECNTREVLDLVGDWIVTSNKIQRTVAGSNQEDNDSLFLLDTTLTDAFTGTTTNTNYLDLSPPINYYNERLTNEATLFRYLKGFPATLTNYLTASGSGIFRAEYSANKTVTAPTLLPDTFLNEIYDVGNYYDGTDTFTALISGVYDFEISYDVDVNTLTPPGIYAPKIVLDFFLKQYDSTGAFLANRSANFALGYNGSTVFTAVTATSRNIMRRFRVNMNAGNYVKVRRTWLDQTLFGGTTYNTTIRVTSYWQCYANANGGGDYQVSDGKDYPVFLHEFDYPISSTEFDQLLAGARQYIRFRQNGQQWKQGRIKTVNYNRNTGMAAFQLYSTLNDQSNAV